MVKTRHRSDAVFWLVLIALFCPVSAVAELQVWLDPESVEEGDNAELNIRINNAQSAPEVDLDSIGADVEVISNSSNSQLRSINGRVESWAIRTITLRPLRTGAITLGPIVVGDEVTETLTLNVAPLSSAVRSVIDATLFFETALLEDSVYVQSQATYVRKLYYAEGAQLYGDLPTAPAVEEALVVALPEVSPYRETRDGKSYGVLEQRYAIFPEKPGRLTVGSASVTGSIILRENGRARRRGIVVKAEEVGIDVAGVPAGYPQDQPWFPAQSVRVEQRWDADVDTLMVGTPVTRRITVNAESATASLIPPVIADLGELNARAYDEAPKLTESAAGTDVIGAREQRTSIVPTASGTSTVPAIEVTWFDTANEQIKVARLAPQTLLVIPDPTAPETTPLALDSASAQSSSANSASLAPSSTPWILATTLACIGWLVTTIYLLRRRRANANVASNSARLTDQQQQSVRSARQLQKGLRAAAKANDLPALRRLVDQWLLAHFQTSLPEATRRWRAHPHAADALDALDRALYSRHHDRPNDAAGAIARAVLDSIEASEAAAAAGNKETAALPELYGNS